eukprot:gene14153-20115_t
MTGLILPEPMDEWAAVSRNYDADDRPSLVESFSNSLGVSSSFQGFCISTRKASTKTIVRQQEPISRPLSRPTAAPNNEAVQKGRRRSQNQLQNLLKELRSPRTTSSTSSQPHSLLGELRSPRTSSTAESRMLPATQKLNVHPARETMSARAAIKHSTTAPRQQTAEQRLGIDPHQDPRLHPNPVPSISHPLLSATSSAFSFQPPARQSYSIRGATTAGFGTPTASHSRATNAAGIALAVARQVQPLIGRNTVRATAMNPMDGLMRGMEALDSGSPTSPSASTSTLSEDTPLTVQQAQRRAARLSLLSGAHGAEDPIKVQLDKRLSQPGVADSYVFTSLLSGAQKAEDPIKVQFDRSLAQPGVADSYVFTSSSQGSHVVHDNDNMQQSTDALLEGTMLSAQDRSRVQHSSNALLGGSIWAAQDSSIAQRSSRTLLGGNMMPAQGSSNELLGGTMLPAQFGSRVQHRSNALLEGSIWAVQDSGIVQRSSSTLLGGNLMPAQGSSKALLGGTMLPAQDSSRVQHSSSTLLGGNMMQAQGSSNVLLGGNMLQVQESSRVQAVPNRDWAQGATADKVIETGGMSSEEEVETEPLLLFLLHKFQRTQRLRLVAKVFNALRQPGTSLGSLRGSVPGPLPAHPPSPKPSSRAFAELHAMLHAMEHLLAQHSVTDEATLEQQAQRRAGKEAHEHLFRQLKQRQGILIAQLAHGADSQRCGAVSTELKAEAMKIGTDSQRCGAVIDEQHLDAGRLGAEAQWCGAGIDEQTADAGRLVAEAQWCEEGKDEQQKEAGELEASAGEHAAEVGALMTGGRQAGEAEHRHMEQEGGQYAHKSIGDEHAAVLEELMMGGCQAGEAEQKHMEQEGGSQQGSAPGVRAGGSSDMQINIDMQSTVEECAQQHERNGCWESASGSVGDYEFSIPEAASARNSTGGAGGHEVTADLPLVELLTETQPSKSLGAIIPKAARDRNSTGGASGHEVAADLPLVESLTETQPSKLLGAIIPKAARDRNSIGGGSVKNLNLNLNLVELGGGSANADRTLEWVLNPTRKHAGHSCSMNKVRSAAVGAHEPSGSGAKGSQLHPLADELDGFGARNWHSSRVDNSSVQEGASESSSRLPAGMVAIQSNQWEAMQTKLALLDHKLVTLAALRSSGHRSPLSSCLPVQSAEESDLLSRAVPLQAATAATARAEPSSMPSRLTTAATVSAQRMAMPLKPASAATARAQHLAMPLQPASACTARHETKAKSVSLSDSSMPLKNSLQHGNKENMAGHGSKENIGGHGNKENKGGRGSEGFIPQQWKKEILDGQGNKENIAQQGKKENVAEHGNKGILDEQGDKENMGSGNRDSHGLRSYDALPGAEFVRIVDKLSLTTTSGPSSKAATQVIRPVLSARQQLRQLRQQQNLEKLKRQQALARLAKMQKTAKPEAVSAQAAAGVGGRATQMGVGVGGRATWVGVGVGARAAWVGDFETAKQPDIGAHADRGIGLERAHPKVKMETATQPNIGAPLEWIGGHADRERELEQAHPNVYVETATQPVIRAPVEYHDWYHHGGGAGTVVVEILDSDELLDTDELLDSEAQLEREAQLEKEIQALEVDLQWRRPIPGSSNRLRASSFR